MLSKAAPQHLRWLARLPVLNAGFWSKLDQGDDFVQWTLRYGCVLFDEGSFHQVMQYLASEDLWPFPALKFARLAEHVRLARRLIYMGDRDAAQDQVRATLTSVSRGLLLSARLLASGGPGRQASNRSWSQPGRLSNPEFLRKLGMLLGSPFSEAGRHRRDGRWRAP